ncbi:MAG: septum formation initiator family protein [bacterium]|nr:septum formation initiator family protein [bacterium]
MKRLTLIVLGVLAVAALGFLSSIVTRGFQEVAETEAELRRLGAEKQELEARIEELEATLQALENDPRAVEALARRELGWIAPGEQVILLITPTPEPTPLSLTEPTPTPILAIPD